MAPGTRDDALTNGWPPRFGGGYGVLVAFLLAFTVFTVATNQAQALLLGSNASRVVSLLSELPGFLALAVITLLALRAEGISLVELGISRRRARLAALAVGGVVVVVNVIVVALALASGTNLTIGLYGQYVRRLNAGPTLLLVGAVNSYLFTGPTEELAFRGYLQNKVLSLIDGRTSRTRLAAGILVTALVFVSLHVPDLLLDNGSAIGAQLGSLLLLAFTAVLFGAIYELTENLVLVVLLHGIGNFWPLVVDPGRGVWPNYLIVLLLYAALVLFYRRTVFTNE